MTEIIEREPAEPAEFENLPNIEVEQNLLQAAAQKLMDEFGFTEEQANLIVRR